MNSKQHYIYCCLSLLMFVMLTGGCSSFNRSWQEAGKVPCPDDNISGRWEGSWQSQANGHQGKLRAILTETESETYQARFYAKYQRILSFEYTFTLHAQHTDSKSTFQGQANLGAWAGGMYQYEGQASPTEFTCHYKSKHDHGIFEMKRVGK